MNIAFKKSYPILLAYLAIFSAGILVQFFFSQEQISVAINQYHNTTADFFFKYLTYMGDGVFCVLLCIAVGIKNRKAGLALLLAYISSALITQGLKHFAFEDMMRPSMLLKHIELHYVSGVDIHQYNSFPSGHSTSAFAIGTILALLIKNSRIRIGILLVTLLVCFSRIYLLQHFFQDTLAGSFVGFTSAFVIYLFLYQNDHNPFIDTPRN